MADGIFVEWTGFKEMKEALEKWEGEAIAAAEKAMDENLEHLLSSAQALAPKLTGELEGSGAKSPVVSDSIRKEISGSVGFNKIYAARRHEENYSPGPITQGKPSVEGMAPGRKYLERPLKHFASRYMQNIADAIKKTTGD